MWNDTDIPLAYLITFRTYGTWLHGDERGSVNRFRNAYKSGYLPEEKSWSEINVRKLKGQPVKLSAVQRTCVEKAIRECCEIRQWRLHAINVRTNHVHTVTAIGEKPAGNALNAFKANATRMMREKKCWTENYSPWVDKGSKRYLWNESDVEFAIDYVLNGQGDDLPTFLAELW